MPEAPAQRDYRRRLPRFDRARTPTDDEIYDLVRAGIQTHLECGCWEDCLSPAAAVIYPAALDPVSDTGFPYRWSFEFSSNDASYYAFMDGTVELTWNGTDKWVSDLVVGPCPGGSGSPTYQWQLTWTSVSLDPTQWTLKLVRNGGTGTCTEWVELVFENVHPFEPICGNLFRPRDRGLVYPYSSGLSCLICLLPAVALVNTTCLATSMSVPEAIGLAPPLTTGGAGSCCDDIFAGGIVFTHTAGCEWHWSSSVCSGAMNWTAEIQIANAGGGNVRVNLGMIIHSGADENRFEWRSDPMPLADVAAALSAPLEVHWDAALFDDTPDITNCDYGAQFEFLHDLTLQPV